MSSIQAEVQLVAKKAINHDCYVFTIKFLADTITFKIGQHFRIYQQVKTKENPDGELVVRKYTPISPCSQTAQIDFLVKIYRPNVHPDFPEGGKLTPILQNLQIGAKLNIQGPFGRFQYQDRGNVTVDGQLTQVDRLFFIAGGSGITPIFQTILEIASMKEQTIELVLVFANKTEEDIVLKQQLQALSPRLRTIHILSQPSENWKGAKGYVTQQYLHSICPLDDPHTYYIHCGPFPMNKFIRQIFTQEFPKSKLFKF